MTSSTNLIVLVAFNGVSYIASQRGLHKAKRSESISLIQWPMPLIYSGLILLFMASALTEAITMTNVVLIGFAGIALMGFGFFRLVNPYGLSTEDEKKKKNEDI
jgi:hypothetical protein